MIVWLLINGRLRATYKLFSIGIIDNDRCQLCSPGRQSYDHIFLQCDYPKSCLLIMRNWLDLKCSQFQFQRIVMFWKNRLKSDFHKRVLAATIAAMVYIIRWARNEAVWNYTIWCPKKVMKHMKNVLRMWISSVLPQKISRRDIEWWDMVRER